MTYKASRPGLCTPCTHTSQIRRARKDAMGDLKGMKDSHSEDELRRHEKEVQNLTDAHVKRVEEAAKAKAADIVGAATNGVLKCHLVQT